MTKDDDSKRVEFEFFNKIKKSPVNFWGFSFERRIKMFTNIRSIAIYVSDMERAKNFYVDILGFEIRADIPQANLCFLYTKNKKLSVYLKAGNKPSKIDNHTCRLSFFLEAEKSINETFNELKKADVKILQEKPDLVADDTFTFQFLDPDGNILEVVGGS